MARALRNYRSQSGQDEDRDEWRSKLFNVDERNFDKLKLPRGTEVYYVVDDATLNEDSSEEEDAKRRSISQCILTCEPSSRAPTWDTGAFMDDFQLYKYREELEMVSNVCKQFAESEQEDFLVTFDESTFPDSFYHAKLKERFGDVNNSSEDYEVFFEHFKKGIMTGYEQWTKAANDTLKNIKGTARSKDEAVSLLKQLLVPTKPFLCVESRRETHGKRVSLHLGHSKAPGLEECAKLRHNKPDNKNAPVSYKFSVHEHNDEIFYQQVSDKLRHVKFQGNVKYPLVVSILKVLGDFPLGTTPGFLLDEFHRCHGYKIDFYGLGFDTFEELLRSNGHVFRIVEDENTTLVFPYWIYWEISVGSFKRELYHDLIILVRGSSKPVPVDDITKQLKHKLNIRVDPASWGIESHELFFRVLLCEWDPRNLDLEMVRAKEYNPDGSYKYLLQAPTTSEEDPLDAFSTPLPKKKTMNVPKLPRIEESVEENAANVIPELSGNNKISSTKKHTSKTSDFVMYTETTIPRSSDFLQPGRRFAVQPELMITPGKFFVTPMANVDQRDEFINEMTDAYATWMTDEEKISLFKIRREHCVVGAYVAIEYEADWHRGRIVEVKHKKYKVLLFDVGCYLKDVPLSDLRYLHKNFESLPEQSFCCTFRQKLLNLTFGEENVKDENYSEELLQEFYSYLRCRKLKIRVVEKLPELDVWEVDVYVSTGSPGIRVNVAKEMMLRKLRW